MHGASDLQRGRWAEIRLGVTVAPHCVPTRGRAGHRRRRRHRCEAPAVQQLAASGRERLELDVPRRGIRFLFTEGASGHRRHRHGHGGALGNGGSAPQFAVSLADLGEPRPGRALGGLLVVEAHEQVVAGACHAHVQEPVLLERVELLVALRSERVPGGPEVRTGAEFGRSVVVPQDDR